MCDLRYLQKLTLSCTDDGYRLTYGGYDFLAMRTFAKRDTIYSVGNQIGTGKESDIYVVADEEGIVNCLKIHRLGRISFRTIKSKRDYLRNGQSASWMYMSRLAAMKEFAFMKVGFCLKFTPCFLPLHTNTMHAACRFSTSTVFRFHDLSTKFATV